MPDKLPLSTHKKNIRIEIQNPYHYQQLPNHNKIQSWVETAYQNKPETSITVRFVNEEESSTLNQSYRSKANATNVLSFVFVQPILPPEVTLDVPPHLGDLVICVPVITQEAKAQKKSLEQHCAHLIIHGLLHLQGYDHTEEQLAHQMETLEINLLETLDYPNPYSTP
ncbi:MAG: rRNA maturation RNase YbeY [Cocleimonas sp.]|nr:rRNA maturation RNase YbeY [Cocleimonas sp.]